MPILSRHDIAKAVVILLEKDVSQRHIARSLAAYLITEHRVQELDSLLRDIDRLRSEQGVLEVTASSAFPLSTAVRSQIEYFLSSGNEKKLRIIINEHIEPELVGGIRLTTADSLLDLTVRSRLNRLRQVTIK